MIKKHITDIVIVAVIILAAFISWIVTNTCFLGKGTMVDVTLDGDLVASHSIDDDWEYVVNVDGFSNTVRISSGEAYMEDANCPDKTCLKHAPINRAGESIICLPHKLVVSVVSDTGDSVDADTY